MFPCSRLDQQLFYFITSMMSVELVVVYMLSPCQSGAIVKILIVVCWLVLNCGSSQSRFQLNIVLSATIHYLSSLSVIISLFQKGFCCYVEERYKEADCEHDLSDNTIDVKKIAHDVIDSLNPARFFPGPGDT